MGYIWTIVILVSIMGLYIFLFNLYHKKLHISPEKRSQILERLKNDRDYYVRTIQSEEKRSSKDRDQRVLRRLKHQLSGVDYKILKLQ